MNLTNGEIDFICRALEVVQTTGFVRPTKLLQADNIIEKLRAQQRATNEVLQYEGSDPEGWRDVVEKMEAF